MAAASFAHTPSNFKSFTLDAAVHPSGLNTSVTAITVNESLSGLGTKGYLVFDVASGSVREVMEWTSYDAGTKTFAVTRSAPQTHAVGCTIDQMVVAEYFTRLKEYVDAALAAPPVAIGSTDAVDGSFEDLTAQTLTVTGTGNTDTVLGGADGAIEFTYASGQSGKGILYSLAADSTLRDLIRGETGGTLRVLLQLNGSGASGLYLTGENSNDVSLEAEGTLSLEGDANNAAHVSLLSASSKFPYLEIENSGGTNYFLFVDNTGDLRIHTSAPTANSDGVVVGTQS